MKPRVLLPTVTLFLVGCASALPTVAPDRAAYAGFDTWQYPGDDVIRAWGESSPYRWIGYYLPSPCHRDSSFAGTRSELVRQGWGIAILYVGQQLFEGETPSEIDENTLCSSQFLTAEWGAVDARDAIALAEAEGFAPGSVIFLDIERMNRLAPEMLAYYESWLTTMIADGRFRPGTYAHIANAAGLYTSAQRLLMRNGISESIPFWIAGGDGFSLGSAPEGVGYPFAHIWQGILDTSRRWGGRTLTVDENVARFPSPSDPESR